LKVLFSNYSCILGISIQIEYDASDYNVGAVDHDHSYDDDDDDNNNMIMMMMTINYTSGNIKFWMWIFKIIIDIQTIFTY